VRKLIALIFIIPLLLFTFYTISKKEPVHSTREQHTYIIKHTDTKINKTLVTQKEDALKTLEGKKIVVDPGHGNKRSGAVQNGIVEKNLTLDVSKRLKDKLESLGATVYLTREGDTDCAPNSDYPTDLSCRPKMANEMNADLFISIHANSGSATATGAEIYYYNEKYKPIAAVIEDEYTKTTGFNNRKVAFGDLHVIRESKVPGVLLELGFLSNPNDANLLKNPQFLDKVTEGISNGIEKALH
jgi:N-acetylmuramoyl-L-alanine amidase